MSILRSKTLPVLAASAIMLATLVAGPTANAVVNGCSARFLAQPGTGGNTHYATSRCTAVYGGSSQRAVLHVNLGTSKKGNWVYVPNTDSSTDVHRYGARAGWETRA